MQNIAVYPDEFTIWETFLDAIPAEMHHALIHDDNLLLEVNTVTKFLAYAICFEQSAWTATHYDQRSSHGTHGPRQPIKVRTFLVKHSKMEYNCNLQFVVQQMLPAGQRPGPGLTGNVPAVNAMQYRPGIGQPGPQAMWNGPPKVGPPKATPGGVDASHKPGGVAAQCYTYGRVGHYLRDCKAPRAQVQAAYMAAVGSNTESNTEEQDELVDNKEAPQEIEEQLAADDAESIQIDGEEYVAVDIYDNDYYACDDEEEHMFALMEHQENRRIHMWCIILQKAADKLQQPQYTAQGKECLVTYVEVNEHPAWML
ncbi:hypothetical protein C0993_006552 [Termitomyces sp. T159_Od127]|nr:hypothetical protein C0993_006552 [Termitomyces sp. T159_Od127]